MPTRRFSLSATSTLCTLKRCMMSCISVIFVVGPTVFGSRVMMSLTVWLKKCSCHRSMARRMSPSVIRPVMRPSESSVMPIPSFPLLTCMMASPSFMSCAMTGRFSLNMMSSAVVSSLRPSSPPGWNCAKSRGLKSRSLISATASASPMARAAVVDDVGARFSGHASLSTHTLT